MRGGRAYEAAFVAVLAALRGESVAYVVTRVETGHAHIARAARHLVVQATRKGDVWSIGRGARAKHGTVAVSRP